MSHALLRAGVGLACLVSWTAGQVQQATFQRDVTVRQTVPYGIAFSPDGSYLAVAGSTGDFDFSGSTGTTLNMKLSGTKRSVVLLDAQTFRIKRQLIQEPESFPAFLSSRIHPMAFSADGTNLIVFHEPVLRVWNAGKGKLVGTWGHDISDVAFCPDRRCALGKLKDGSYELLDLQNGRSLGAFAAQPEGTLLPLDAERPYLAYLKAGNLCLKNLKTGEEMALGPSDGKKLTGAVWSPDGGKLAATTDAGAFTLWSLADKTKLAERAGAGKSASDPAFAPDGSLVVFVADGTVHVWSQAGALASFKPTHVFAVRGAVFAADSHGLATMGALVDPAIKIWALSAGSVR